ncbi:MAG: hypothetical protein U0Z26_06970 [Anaerolineales bacterium]
MKHTFFTAHLGQVNLQLEKLAHNLKLLSNILTVSLTNGITAPQLWNSRETTFHLEHGAEIIFWKKKKVLWPWGWCFCCVTKIVTLLKAMARCFFSWRVIYLAERLHYEAGNRPFAGWRFA